MAQLMCINEDLQRFSEEDVKSGTPTITISKGVCTFSEAQTNNQISVGTKITFNISTKIYIKSITSDTQFVVELSNKTAPSDVGSPINVVSVCYPINALGDIVDIKEDAYVMDGGDLAFDIVEVNGTVAEVKTELIKLNPETIDENIRPKFDYAIIDKESGEKVIADACKTNLVADLLILDP